MQNLKIKNAVAGLCFGLVLSGCATSTGIFPEVVTSLSETALVLPNPISIVVDQANSQIVVANSNVDIFFDTGSLAVLGINATDTNAPVLTARHVISTPNYAGQIYFDNTTNNLYIPYRESHPDDDSQDQMEQYTLSAAGELTLINNAAVRANPFGIAGSTNEIYVVSDDFLSAFGSVSLGFQNVIDLTAAETAAIDDTDAGFVESVVVDTTGNRLFVSNTGGRLFVIDLATDTLSQVLVGPTSTRSLIISNNTLYALDPVEEAVWIFDLTLLAAPASAPSTVDDSTFLITTISVGNNPNGVALDPNNNRLYVSNTDDNTISVIDTLTLEELTRISVDGDDISSGFLRDLDQPFGLALGTFNGATFLFVAGFNANSIGVINTGTLNVVEIFPNNNL